MHVVYYFIRILSLLIFWPWLEVLIFRNPERYSLFLYLFLMKTQANLPFYHNSNFYDASDLILHMWNELNLNIRTKWYKEHSKNHHRIQSNQTIMCKYMYVFMCLGLQVSVFRYVHTRLDSVPHNIIFETKKMIKFREG